MSEWISVKNKLPIPGQVVLAIEDGAFYLAWLDDDMIRSDGNMSWHDLRNGWDLEKITYWMPLPDAPKD